VERCRSTRANDQDLRDGWRDHDLHLVRWKVFASHHLRSLSEVTQEEILG
jgi:hypothetical protein